MMNCTELDLRGLLLISPRVFKDDRGYFFESFNEAVFRLSTGLNVTFVQDNESLSHRGIFRGLHFQVPPKSQAKLIRVVKGSIIDVVVDLRRSSETFGQHACIELTEENQKQLFIPEGFAHGFLVMENNTIVNYKCNNYYSPDAERCLSVFDSALNIELPIPSSEWVMSEKDKQGNELSELSGIFF
jgi:dTDP-4-dehydrorhamnose 3,5-epimerase